MLWFIECMICDESDVWACVLCISPSLMGMAQMELMALISTVTSADFIDWIWLIQPSLSELDTKWPFKSATKKMYFQCVCGVGVCVSACNKTLLHYACLIQAKPLQHLSLYISISLSPRGNTTLYILSLTPLDSICHAGAGADSHWANPTLLLVHTTLSHLNTHTHSDHQYKTHCLSYKTKKSGPDLEITAPVLSQKNCWAF